MAKKKIKPEVEFDLDSSLREVESALFWGRYSMLLVSDLSRAKIDGVEIGPEGAAALVTTCLRKWIDESHSSGMGKRYQP